MTPPPINIDGTGVEGVNIDGQDVEEITVDGQVVFSAGTALGESWETAYPGNWQGSTGQYNQVSTDPFDGSNHLQKNTTSTDIIYFKIDGLVTQSGGFSLEIYKNKNSVSFGEGGPVILNQNGDGYIYRDNGTNANFSFVNNFTTGGNITGYKSNGLNVPGSGYYYTKVTVSGTTFTIEYFDTNDNSLDGPFTVSDNTFSGVDFYIGFDNSRAGARTDLIRLIDNS